MVLLLLLLFITLLQLPPSSCEVKRELSMVQILFRHGARNTLHPSLLENDPDQFELIRNVAQLTEIGINQMNIFGQIMRLELLKQDGRFLSEKYNRSEIHIVSSDSNRTLESAMSFMSGLYPTNQIITIDKDEKSSLKKVLLPPFQQHTYYYPTIDGLDTSNDYFNKSSPVIKTNRIQPFAIHSFGKIDPILHPKCPKWQESHKVIEKEVKNKINKEIQKYKDVITRVSSIHMNLTSQFTFSNVTKLWDLLYCQNERGINYGVSKKDYRTIMYLKSYIKLLSKFPLEHSKLIVSPLLSYIFQQFDDKILGNSSLKLIVESTHDGQILPMMMAFGLISAKCLKQDFENSTKNCQLFPPFASSFVFELFDSFYEGNQDSQYPVKEIRVKYNGNIISICGSKQYCEYEIFKKQMQENVMVNSEKYYEECGVKAKIKIPKYENEQEQRQLDIFEKLYQFEHILNVLLLIKVPLLIGLIIVQSAYIFYLKFKMNMPEAVPYKLPKLGKKLK